MTQDRTIVTIEHYRMVTFDPDAKVVTLTSGSKVFDVRQKISMSDSNHFCKKNNTVLWSDLVTTGSMTGECPVHYWRRISQKRCMLGQSFYRTLIGNHARCKRVTRVCQHQLTFLLFFFLRHVQRSNHLTDFDALWLKMRRITQGCAFLGLKYLILTFDSYLCPKNVKFCPQNMKHESPSISETTKPMDLQLWYNVKNVK